MSSLKQNNSELLTLVLLCIDYRGYNLECNKLVLNFSADILSLVSVNHLGTLIYVNHS